MGLVIKISAKSKPKAIQKELERLNAGRKKKSLSDYYGALPVVYEDGLIYQKKQRDEWQ